MNYEIVATLGPASDTESKWEAFVSAGVTAFRLNTSHLSLEQVLQWLDRISPFLSSLDPRPQLVLDLQASKWRLGYFTSFDLEPDQTIEFICTASTDKLHALPVAHRDFFQAAKVSSGEIVLNDAKINLVIESVDSDSIKAKVTKGGSISPRKGITFTSSEYRKESLNEKDQEILAQTMHLDFIRYAISYVKDAVEMSGYRELIGRSAYLIAKLERRPAIDEVIQIAKASDELWLCRGDLGAELGFKAMAEAVHQFSDLVKDLSLPVLLAGQVLEHMSECPSPTRSELCYLYDALTRGYGGLVLSDETAIGKYPLESCHVAALFRTRAG